MPLSVRKRTIGNVEYTEEIFRLEIFTLNEDVLLQVMRGWNGAK